MPFKPIPFLGGAYESRSIPADHQRCVNLFPETDSEGGVSMLLGTPGSVPQFTLGIGPVRGAGVMNGRSFFVSGNTLYETTNGTPAALGTLLTSTGRVSIANNNTQLLIVDGVAGYTSDGTAVTQITDPDFPNGVTKAEWEGEFFIVSCDGSKEFFASAPADGTSWDGLDFASARDKPETIVSIAVTHDRLILFTATGTEQWVNTGNAEFAFERDNGSSSEIGCEARDTVVTMNNGLYWLGRDKDGGGIVFSLGSGTPTRISTHAIEHLIQSVPRSDAYAFAYQQEGHSFYCLTIPALERTFCYDAATQKWHERAWWDGTAFRRWRPAFHVFSGSKHLVGDYATGVVSALDLDVPTDNGGTIRRLRTTAPIKSSLARQFFNGFQLDLEVGQVSDETLTPQVMLRYSNDGGMTWSSERRHSIGATGQFAKRVVFYRCGIGRVRVWEVVISDAVRVALYGAQVMAELEAA